MTAAADVLRLADELVDLLAQIDRSVTAGADVPPETARLARAARAKADALLAVVAQLHADDSMRPARRKAERIASYAFVLDRRINGGTLQ
jgi:hypothetical protein